MLNQGFHLWQENSCINSYLTFRFVSKYDDFFRAQRRFFKLANNPGNYQFKGPWLIQKLMSFSSKTFDSKTQNLQVLHLRENDRCLSLNDSICKHFFPNIEKNSLSGQKHESDKGTEDPSTAQEPNIKDISKELVSVASCGLQGASKMVVEKTKVHLNETEKNLLLRELILQRHEYNWNIIAQQLGSSKEKAITLWQEKVYPSVKLGTSIAGALKWSMDQDGILTGFIKRVGFNWKELAVFLPGRTQHSAQGRRRRLMKCFGVSEDYINKLQEQFPWSTEYMSKHQYRKHILREIARKMKKAEQKNKAIVIFQNSID